jgi:hypothetical protein
MQSGIERVKRVLESAGYMVSMEMDANGILTGRLFSGGRPKVQVVGLSLFEVLTELGRKAGLTCFPGVCVSTQGIDGRGSVGRPGAPDWPDHSRSAETEVPHGKKEHNKELV